MKPTKFQDIFTQLGFKTSDLPPKYELRAEYLQDDPLRRLTYMLRNARHKIEKIGTQIWRPYMIVSHHRKEELEKLSKKIRSRGALYNADENRITIESLDGE